MRLNLEHVARLVLPRVPPGRVLSPRERGTLVAAAEVLLAGAPSAVTPAQAADNVETFLRIGRSRRAWRVRLLLELVEALPLATDGQSFSALSWEGRRAHIEQRWIAGGHLFRICSKLKNLVILGAYGDPRAAAATGYVPVGLRARFRERAVPRPASEAL